jgi:hypothetical protein
MHAICGANIPRCVGYRSEGEWPAARSLAAVIRSLAPGASGSISSSEEKKSVQTLGWGWGIVI